MGHVAALKAAQHMDDSIDLAVLARNGDEAIALDGAADQPGDVNELDMVSISAPIGDRANAASRCRDRDENDVGLTCRTDSSTAVQQKFASSVKKRGVIYDVRQRRLPQRKPIECPGKSVAAILEGLSGLDRARISGGPTGLRGPGKSAAAIRRFADARTSSVTRARP